MTSREEGQNCALAKVSTGASGDSKTQKLCIASFFQKFHRAETGMSRRGRYLAKCRALSHAKSGLSQTFGTYCWADLADLSVT